MTINRRLLSTLEQERVKTLLVQAPVGFLAVASESPFVVPINFVHDCPDDEQHWGEILFHTGEGRKSRAIDADARVCIAILSEASLQLGPLPCDDGFSYQSVLIEGEASLLTDTVGRERALRLLVAKHDPESVRKPFDQAILARTRVYSVAIDAVSFKQRPKRP